MSTPATTITVTADTDQVTLVNVFTVDPKRQIELIDALDDATRQIFVTLPASSPRTCTPAWTEPE